MILLNLPQSFVFIIIEAIVAFAFGYAFRGFISRELVKAAADAKEYLAKGEAEVNDAVKKL